MTPIMFEKIRKIFTTKNLYVSGKSEEYWQKIDNGVTLRTRMFALDVFGCDSLPVKAELSEKPSNLNPCIGHTLYLPHFAESLTDCLRLVHWNSPRNYGCVVNVDIADGYVNYVGTDGFALYRARYNHPQNTDEKISFRIGYQESKALSLLLAKQDLVKMRQAGVI